MNTRYRSRFEEWNARPWVRGLSVVVLAVILSGNAVAITIARLHRDGGHIDFFLGLIWLLSLVGLAVLVRLWRATVTPRRPSPLYTGSDSNESSNNRWRGP